MTTLARLLVARVALESVIGMGRNTQRLDVRHLLHRQIDTLLQCGKGFEVLGG